MVTPIPSGAFHVSRQRLARTLDFSETARNDAQLDAALAQATADVEGYLHRGFFPWYGTRYLNWPDVDTSPTSYRIWLNDDELISLYSATAGGQSVSGLIGYPLQGPPYSRVETSFGGNDVFQSGDTWQAAIALTGMWGYQQRSSTVALIATTITDTATTLLVDDGSHIGTGNVLLLDSEYVVVSDVSPATTSQTLSTPLTATNSNASVVVSGGTFHPGEVLTLDAERMLVLDVAGTTLLVKRAWDGTVLATHTGSTIYADRSLSITRAQCISEEGPYPGALYPAVDLYPNATSTATSHLAGVNVRLHEIPPAVQLMTIAEASWNYAQNAAGWQVAPGTANRATAQEQAMTALQDLRDRTMRAVGRKGRQRTV